MRTSKTVFYYNGKSGTIKDFSVIYNIPYSKLYNRLINLGWTIREAIEKESDFRSDFGGIDTYKCDDGVKRSLPKIASKYKVEYNTLRNRIKRYNDKNIDINFELIYKEILNIKNKNKVKIFNQKKKENISKAFNNNFIIDKNDPIYKLCVKNNRNYILVSNRMKKEGFSFEEAINIPLDFINTKNIIYNDQIGSLKYICKKNRKDFLKVYNMLLMSYDLNYIMSLEETNL